MKILFYCPDAGGKTEWAEWLPSIERAMPGAQVRVWQPGDTAYADYALVWRAPRELFARGNGLKAIFNLGAGVDALLALEREAPGTLPKGVPIVRLEGTGMAEQMAEYAIYAVLRYMRRFDEYELEQRRANPRWLTLGPHPIESFTVTVLGLGALGAHVASSLRALGLPVRGYSRTSKTLEGVKTFAGPSMLDAALDGAKVLVNLLPGTRETEGILNRDRFAKLAQGAYLVNLARGAHLVEADLLDALANGQIAAAMLDVFSEEPLPPQHRFWREPRVTITPHISALTLRGPAVAQIAQKIEALERGQPISGIVDLARGY
jgi:glyoxylate/hydroxypyruvate reductase A